MTRSFYTMHETTNKPIRIVQGEMGYFPLEGIPVNLNTEQALSDLNQLNGNTSADIDVAIGCSMFGWDTPLADKLS